MDGKGILVLVRENMNTENMVTVLYVETVNLKRVRITLTRTHFILMCVQYYHHVRIVQSINTRVLIR